MMVVMTPGMWKETLVFLLELVTVMVAGKGNSVTVTLTVQNMMAVMMTAARSLLTAARSLHQQVTVMVKLVADLLSLRGGGGTLSLVS